MKRYILIAVITVIAVGLFGQITFDPQPADEASNIQGSVFKWNEITDQYEKQPGASLYVKLYYDNGSLYDEAYIYADDNGEYSHDFLNPNENQEDCNEVDVKYLNATYSSDYDGIVRIDIYYHPETIPGTD